MTTNFSQAQRSTICVPRWKIQISALATVVSVAAMLVSLMASAGESAAANPSRETPLVFPRLSNIPSHNGLYRASLIPQAADAYDATGSRSWVLDVERANGIPVEDATLTLETWMPDDDRTPATRPRVTGYLGDGRYRVEGVRIDGPGWWNVRLAISASTGTDSLAFNVVR